VLAVLLPAFLVQCYKIDPDTEPRTIIRRRDKAELQLVMSDEFSLDGRSFAKGDDDVFEAQHRPDDINQAISFCEWLLFVIIGFFLFEIEHSTAYVRICFNPK
jgi:Beta-glucan synthesis-associated protein SKN1/KRE6/Sbg1